jgi:hypothetical protein
MGRVNDNGVGEGHDFISKGIEQESCEIFFGKVTFGCEVGTPYISDE